MVTMKEIAQLANVSTVTVSGVLNGKKGAASEAKAREIMEVAKRLNYTPNSLARSLQQKKTNNIGVIAEDLTAYGSPEIIDGIDEYCEDNGYEVLIGNMRLYKRFHNDYADTEKHRELSDIMVRTMIAKQVEAIIYVGYHTREISYLPTMVNVPFVYAYCYPADPFYPAVIFDDEKAAYDITSILLDKGHTSLGVIGGPLTSNHTQNRLKGFQKALFDRNILYNASNVLYGDWDRLSGYTNTDKLLDAGVTAIFAFNDTMASGVYEKCSERGLKIGKDISLFGFDNTAISVGHTTPISTAEPPLHEIGMKSAELALKQIKRQQVQDKRCLLQCKILERKSVGWCPVHERKAF